MSWNFVEAYAKWTAAGIEAVAITFLIGGIAVALVRFAWQLHSGRRAMAGYLSLRANLGRVVLLSLELLVAADIVETVSVELTLESLGNLALIVLIRTFLSFAIEVEIEGRWPWQGSPESEKV